MKTISQKAQCRAVAGLAAGLVLGGLLATTAAADMYRWPASIPVEDESTNVFRGVQAQSTITSQTTVGNTSTVCWYGMQGWYTVEMSTNGGTSWSAVGRTAATSHSTCLSVDNGGNSNAVFRLNQNNRFAGSGACAGCHGDKFASWKGTVHSVALSALKNIHMDKNQSCFPCHTVGALQPTGYTDLVNTPHLTDVGCESCHGPAGWHKDSSHDLIHPAISIDPAICGRCHQGSHHPTYEEYSESLHGQVNDDIKYGFSKGVYFPDTVVVSGKTLYGYYITTNANGSLKTNATTGIVNSSYVPGSAIDPGRDRQAQCGVCHSGAARAAMLEDYEIRQENGVISPLILPAASDAGAWGPTCANCHDPHEYNTNYTAQLRYPTKSTNFYTMPTTSDKVTTLTTNGATVTTNVIYWNTTFASLYNPNIQVCGQCHNNRGARWDGKAYGLYTNTVVTGYVTNTVPVDIYTNVVTTNVIGANTYYTTNSYIIGRTNGVVVTPPATNLVPVVTVISPLVAYTNGSVLYTTNSSGYSRPPHFSGQYNMLIGILEPDYFNTNSAGVATNRMHAHGSRAAKQCATCHVPNYAVSSTANYTGHKFELDYSGCMVGDGTTAGCHSTYNAAGLTAKVLETQLTQSNSVQRVLSLLTQWAVNKSPDILRTNYGGLAWDYSLPELGTPTLNTNLVGPTSTYKYISGWPIPSGTNDNLQLQIPEDIRRARFNVYMVAHDGSLGVHNPSYVSALLADADSKVSQYFTNANFSAKPVSGQVPLSVVFSNAPGLSSWSWDFGDGQFSTSSNPTNIYTNAGIYSVTFTANGSETMTRKAYIRVTAPPTVSFAADQTLGQAPFTVTFTNTSTGTSDVTQWRWTMGSSSFYTGVAVANLTYTFTNAGVYTIALRATAGGGNTSTTVTNYIRVVGANFTGSPTSGVAPMTVTFTNLSLGATNYAWSFGDGNTSTGTNVVNVYTNAGTYPVTLQASYGGVTSTLVRSNYIVVGPGPVPSFSFTPTNGVVPLTVTFSNLSTYASAYSWNFGDGHVSTSTNPVNVFTNSGTYSIVLKASNLGVTNAVTNSLVVSPAPVANLSAGPLLGWAPLTVSFTNLSLNATAYAWDFGDGRTSTSVNPSNTYSNAGDYVVTLKASNLGVTNTLILSHYIHVATQ